MDEAAVPTGPTRRNVLVKGLASAENRYPSVAALGAAERRAKRGAPGAQRRNFRVPVFCRFQAMDKDVSPCRACWDRSLCHME
eukprot:15205576-Alexandrium_andersonii.AAC.1